MLERCEYKKCPDGMFSRVVAVDAELFSRESVEYFKVSDKSGIPVCFVAADIQTFGISIHLEMVSKISRTSVSEMKNDFLDLVRILKEKYGERRILASFELLESEDGKEMTWMKFIKMFEFNLISVGLLAEWKGN